MAYPARRSAQIPFNKIKPSGAFLSYKVMLRLIQMKYALTIIIVSGFASIALFGVFTMHDSNHSIECAADTNQGAICPMLGNAIDSFQKISIAAFGKNPNAFLLLLTSLLCVSTGIWASILYKPRKLAYSRLKFNSSPPPQKIALKRWLSLFENSPSIRR